MVMQTKIIKGKASFYAYKRKLMTIHMNSNIRDIPKEGYTILKECFHFMKETIAILGSALDQDMLDEEGSKLLDWAMIDCLSVADQLGHYQRCLLCRRKKSLKNSHIWPKFIAKSMSEEQIFIFGHNKHILKSAGNCTYQMLCQDCEGLICQNGEDDFQAKFQPALGNVTYSSWLFSFCTGVIFRCLSTIVTFPQHFNDDEVYKLLLQCRKHLLSKKVKINNKQIYVNEHESRRLENLDGQPDIFLFMSPQNPVQKYGGPYPKAVVALSRDKQLDKIRSHFNGFVHFILLCCEPITLVVNFGQSLPLDMKGSIHLVPSESVQKYTVPSEEERVSLLPVGVWAMIEMIAEESSLNFSKVFRFTAENAKLSPEQHIVPDTDLSLKLHDPNILLSFNFLPKGYEIFKPHKRRADSQCVMLPGGDQVILHSTLSVPMQHTELSFLLCITQNSIVDCEFYIIFVSTNDRAHFLYVDGAKVEIRNNKLALTEFLQTNVIADNKRYSLSGLQQLLDKVSPNKHFDNINFLLYLVKSRRLVTLH